MVLGFNVGATVEFPVSDAFAVQSGLILNTKGVKIDASQTGYTYENKMTLTCLDIPINAKYSLDLSGTKLYFAAGPYVSFALKGKYDEKDGPDGDVVSSDGDLEIGNDEEKDDIKRMDFGLNFGAGVEFGAIGVGAQYGLGLSNLVPGGDSDNTMKNRLISISLSYKFGK
ncbi:MAG: PorT family protein [Chloroflexia bacterium]|nr:PorT family protein [Chloroflexia bacterium]